MEVGREGGRGEEVNGIAWEEEGIEVRVEMEGINGSHGGWKSGRGKGGGMGGNGS